MLTHRRTNALWSTASNIIAKVQLHFQLDFHTSWKSSHIHDFASSLTSCWLLLSHLRYLYNISSSLLLFPSCLCFGSCLFRPFCYCPNLKFLPFPSLVPVWFSSHLFALLCPCLACKQLCPTIPLSFECLRSWTPTLEVGYWAIPYGIRCYFWLCANEWSLLVLKWPYKLLSIESC